MRGPVDACSKAEALPVCSRNLSVGVFCQIRNIRNIIYWRELDPHVVMLTKYYSLAWRRMSSTGIRGNMFHNISDFSVGSPLVVYYETRPEKDSQDL